MTTTATAAPHSSAPRPAAGSARAFVPALEGMRGLAALGVVLTHTAFQTGATATPVLGRVWERFDMAVAVFFGLSGFLLWRPHAAAARGIGTPPRTGRYLLHRAARILPAYWVVVCAVLILLPGAAHSAGKTVWLSNLALLQIYIPLTLTDGLTQMWSLAVEVSFYLVLPVLALLLCRLRGPRARWRAPIVLGLGLVALVWNFLPVPAPGAIHSDNWLPGYLPWFVSGMSIAELAEIPVVAGPQPRWRRLAANRRWMTLLAVTAFALAATDLAGPPGLTRGAPWQYAAKMGLGALIGFGLLAPLVLGPGPHRWLSGRVAAALGRWSYGVFLWHLAVLGIVFPVFGWLPFQGEFPTVLVLTVGFTLPLAAAGYALIEEPVRHWVRQRT
ncbi:acyltransferase family protein [Nocardia stercoris]|uniref:Acyltransferase n=1 Tax=Nocardia stercoris TaxID=2483361 RepID=A0A3M2L8E6_9NOCA|nr:acyltransferase [Nocardia stercoris]RMI33952.1 acyltransferase [Nocardia stercoris]